MFLYYAIFESSDGKFAVEFPDLDGAFTFGDDMHDALAMAKDLLEGWLIVAEDEGDNIPEPSAPDDIDYPDGSLLIPIEIDLDLARLKHANTLVKKTLTIPKYLNILAEQESLNFSATLTEALKEKLGV